MINRDTFNFTPEFEDLTIASYVATPEKFFCRGELLQPQYFSSVVAALFMQCLLKYQQQYSRVPSWEAMGQLLEDECEAAGVETKAAHEYIHKLRSISVNDTDFVVDRIVLFCRERATLNAVKHVAKCLRDGKLPAEGCTRLFEDALHIGQNLDDIGYILHHAVDQVVDKVNNPGFGVRTGLPQFDNIWRTGWAPGWLITLLAPPKRFKTTYALNIALSVVGHGVGEDVLYYPCEISQEQAALKCFFNLSGMDENAMFDSIESFKVGVKGAISQKIAANMVVKHFPIGTASISDIKAHARMVIKQLGIRPKMVVIDYADTVRPSDPNQPPHLQQANIYKEAIAFGKEIGACIVMPDRCTADAVDKRVPNMRSFQGAFAKGGIVDLAMGLCATEAEYAKNILRTFVFINRHGAAFQHWQGSVDAALSRVNIGDEIGYNPEEDEQGSESPDKPHYSSNRGKKKKANDVPDELQ